MLVKPLVWKEAACDNQIAHGAGRLYAINPINGLYILSVNEMNCVTKSAHVSMETAKMYAQEDHYKHIFSFIQLRKNE